MRDAETEPRITSHPSGPSVPLASPWRQFRVSMTSTSASVKLSTVESTCLDIPQTGCPLLQRAN
jgi:hypothetical protein